MTNKEYDNLVKKTTKPTNKIKNCTYAFLVGGAICTFGQILFNLYKSAGLSEKLANMAVPVTLIALAAIATGLQFYDKLASFAGAGSLVPITGFANAMVSPAIEYKTEGHVMGIGAKMFTIAGPVIVFGLLSSFVYGLILYLFKIF